MTTLGFCLIDIDNIPILLNIIPSSENPIFTMTSSILRDVYYQFTILPMPKNDFNGKIAIVTGSNTDLGLETARTIASLNAKKVILAVSDMEKGELAKQSIEESTGRRGVIEVWQLDLLSFKSVLEFAARAQNLPRLGIIVENAAPNAMSFRKSEGHESSVTVNVPSTFLLALNALPKLRATAQKFHVTPHLVVVSSGLHYVTSFPQSSADDIYAALGNEENPDMADRYSITKLMDALLVRASGTSQASRREWSSCGHQYC